MKLIFSKAEFVEAQHVLDNMVEAINKQVDDEEDKMEYILLIHELKQENKFFTMNMVKDSIEININEEFIIDVIKYYDYTVVETMPLILKIQEIIDPIVAAIKAVVGLFDKKFVNDCKACFGRVAAKAEASFEKYL